MKPDRPVSPACILLLAVLLAFLPACSEPAGPAASAVGAKTLRIALRSEPPTLDPSLATDTISFDLLTNLMEGLTQYDANLQPIPAVAERWEFSEGGRVIRFFIRDNAAWSDGKPVTAHDFEYSWKRLLNPATAAEYAYFLFDIENAYEYNSGTIQDPAQVGVRAESDRVLYVRLKRPVIYFPSIATFMVTAPLRKDVIEQYGDRWTDPAHIVTNGAFTLKEWRHEYKLLLEANPLHFEGRPAIDQVRVYLVRDAATELTLYETGELDVTGLPPVAIPEFRNHAEFRNRPLLRGYYYGFNVEKAPFDKPLVRRALAHAVDRSRFPVILKGEEVPTASWIPKGMFAYNPDIGPRFDPEHARRLLSEAGYPQGRGFPAFSIHYNTDPTNQLIAQYVQAQWRQHLGLDVTLEEMEWKVFLKRLQVDPPPVYRLGWGADFPDPDNFMNLFTSTSGNNHSRWGNPRYDRLIADAAAEADPQKRQGLYDQAQRLLTEEDVPIISMFVTTKSMLVAPRVRGFHLNAMELMYLKKVELVE
ncbi:MAG: peptide ABC transporter substrate-binding protein [Nitrospina sp.]|nr:peptide ABC transporter substrate-binding protein [Nitrospina sp.]